MGNITMHDMENPYHTDEFALKQEQGQNTFVLAYFSAEKYRKGESILHENRIKEGGQNE